MLASSLGGFLFFSLILRKGENGLVFIAWVRVRMRYIIGIFHPDQSACSIDLIDTSGEVSIYLQVFLQNLYNLLNETIILLSVRVHGTSCLYHSVLVSM